MSAAPVPEEMDRMVPPTMIANLTFGGTVLVQEDSGMLCSPMGMVTCQKAMQYCCFPSCVQIAFAYTDGAYSKGVQVDSKPGGCCGKAYWTISSKDYTVPAGEEDLGGVGKSAVANMRKNGKSDAEIAKLYPKKVALAKTVRTEKKCCGPLPSWGVSLADGSSNELVFQVKNKPICCGQCLACPMWKNCSEGITKGKMCMNFKNPIYDKNNQKVAYIVQTVPLFPTSCCTADTGPTIQMAIHMHPDYSGPPLSQDDIHRLTLFMYTVVPSVPGGGNGGPAYFIGKVANVLLMKTGWALGFGQTEVEQEYLTFKQVFNGEVADIGYLLKSMRGGAGMK